MSYENSKRNSFRETSILKGKLNFKLNKPATENHIKSFKKLPLINQKKYSSTKNLIVSSTCDITSFPEQFKNSHLKLIKKKFINKNQEKHLQTEAETEPIDVKYFFQKRKNVIQSIDSAQLKKYSSCNKLASFPSIPQIHVANDQSYLHNQNMEPERQIKSTNSIKLQTIQYLKRPKLERIPLKKILRCQMSKTINPRKIQSEHSIEIQNEEKNIVVKKRIKLSKDIFERLDSKTKILVKNPFNKLPKKHSQLGDKFEIMQNLQHFEQQLRLSKIFEDTNNESEISVRGKSDIQNLIGYMNM